MAGVIIVLPSDSKQKAIGRKVNKLPADAEDKQILGSLPPRKGRTKEDKEQFLSSIKRRIRRK